MLIVGEVSVLFVSVSVVPRKTNVSDASCKVQVRAAVTEPVIELLKPPFVRVCGKGKLVGPEKLLVPVQLLVVSSAAKVWVVWLSATGAAKRAKTRAVNTVRRFNQYTVTFSSSVIVPPFVFARCNGSRSFPLIFWKDFPADFSHSVRLRTREVPGG